MSQEETKNAPDSTKKEEEKKKQALVDLTQNSEVGTMKKGDYMIHVFIETVRQLKCGEEGSNVDPIVEVECIKEKKYTSAKQDIGVQSVVHWHEHLFFEPKGLSQADIEQAKISLRVMDKGMLKNTLIGMFEFDVAFIYFMPHHTMFHKWIVLSDPNSPNFDEVTGYMKLSISVAAGGDEQVQITEDVAGSEAESAMMPPQIKPQFFQLKFRFFKAEKLPIMDMALFSKQGSIDAYVTTQYMKKKLKTKTVTMKNETVFWDQEFLIPQSLPIMTGKIKMQLFDEDRVSDEIVGSMEFNAKDILGGMNGKFFWKNVYGAPLGKSGENTKEMNNNPELASTWKGRILMQVVAEKVDKPMIECVDLDDEAKHMALAYMEDKEYEIIAEVGLGISLPAEKKYSVKIKIADFELRTDKPKPQAAEATYNRWNQRFPVTVYTCPYQDVLDIGTIFIYLMDGDKPICYARDHITNFLDPNAKLRWYELLPDLSLGKIKDHHKAGIISLKMSINDRSRNGPVDFKKFKAWSKDPPKRPMNKKVRAYIFQCRDLPAADEDGSSDPYVCIWDTSKTLQKTKYVEDNVNPLFYTTMELMYEANSTNVADMPPFVIDVYDKDFGLDGDDFLCRAIINVEDAAFSEKEPDKIPTPRWHTLRLKQGAPPCGEILISFSVVDDDFNFKVPLPYVNLTEFVKFEEFTVECNVLGLRALQSVGILPVKKAYIQFNLKSLLPPDNAQAIENIQTQPGPAGADPTINTLIKFSCPLPIDPLYCPRLSCIVFDNIFKGFMQPLLGTFTIPIGDILQQKFQQRAEEKQTFQHLIDELEKIIKDEGIVSYVPSEQASEVDNEEFRQMQAQERDEIDKQISQASSKKKEPTLYDGIETKKQESLKKPLLCMDDYNYSDDEDERQSLTKKSKSKVSPGSFQEESKSPSRSVSPNKESDILSSADSKTSWFRRLWHKIIRKKIQDQITEEQRQQRLFEAQREMDYAQTLGHNPNLALRTVVRPEYELDERLNAFKECNIPPESLYIALGWDETPEQKRKHYRKFFPDELENVRDVMPRSSPFDQYDLKRGQSRGASRSLFSFKRAKEDDSGSVSTEKIVGKFKGLVNIVSEADRSAQEEERRYFLEQIYRLLNKVSLKKARKPLDFKIEQLDTHNGRMKFRLDLENLGLQHLSIHSHLQRLTFDDSLKRMLMAQNQCIVRLYVISAFDLSSRDIGSESDPYLYITLGNRTYNERKNYQDDQPNPDFYKMFEFEATFPGCPMLNLAIYDYDDLFGDDLIGETKIDLEDRFFSPEWQSLKFKPIEYRQLYHQSSKCSQGQVKCWVEIVDKNDQEVEVFDITKKPPEHYEVRVCVFDTIDVKAMDDDGCSDVFIKCFFNQKDGIKETDTHFRCQDGRASFNYRMKLDFSHPKKLKNQYELTIQAFDRDFFKSNDIIGETRINLFNLIEDCSLTQRPISLSQKYYNQLLKGKGITLTFKDENTFLVDIIGSGVDKKGKREVTGKIRLQIDVLPKDQAEQNKVGEARQEPNCNPYLPPPIGRLSFSLNPFKMFTQLVGPRLRRKLYCYCCIIICCALCVSMFPLILSQMMSSLLNPFD